MDIFVIGDENAILGFSLVGIEGQVVKSLDEAKKALDACFDAQRLENPADYRRLGRTNAGPGR